MILILSTPTDYDTQAVIDWLCEKNVSFFRLNDEDIMTGVVSFNLDPINIQKTHIKRGKEKLFFKDVSVVWLRKFGFFTSYKDIFGENSDITKYIYSEFSVIRTNIFNLLKNKRWLFNKHVMRSKIEILQLARTCGLNIPRSIITSEKKILKSFFQNNSSSIISKSLGDGKHIVFKNKKYSFYTQHINDLTSISEKFTPSLFQQYIDKKYELRIFFIDRELFAMAIFSQNNKKTIIDFRNYDYETPNRLNPYNLPKDIERKIIKLMNKIGLNTGSIDMIKGLDNEYYFLEVNPSGQFGMTSIPCNYNLHEKVADYLIKKNH